MCSQLLSSRVFNWPICDWQTQDAFHSYSILLITKLFLCGEKKLSNPLSKKLNSVSFQFMKTIVRHQNFHQWTIGKLWYLVIRLNLLISVQLLSLLQHPRTPNALDRQLHSWMRENLLRCKLLLTPIRFKAAFRFYSLVSSELFPHPLNLLLFDWVD